MTRWVAGKNIFDECESGCAYHGITDFVTNTLMKVQYVAVSENSVHNSCVLFYGHGAAQGSVSVTMCGGVLRDHGGPGSLCPSDTGGYPACYQCGVASTQCGGIGSPGAGVPLYQATLLASFPLVAPRLPLVAW